MADTNTTPNLTDYDTVLINSSAGKDSQAMLTYLVKLADAQGVSRDRLVVVHCDLGRVEWKGTLELAREQAEAYGLRFEVVSRPQGDLIDQIRARGMFPSSKARYCTSDHKRGQVRKVMTMLVRELGLDRQARLLNCMGLRADESPARAKKVDFEIDTNASNGKREVTTWLPIHGWNAEKVWATIKESGLRYHEAYDLGMSRLSCAFCIFASRKDLLISARANPELLETYVELEAEIDHRFTVALSVKEIQDMARTFVPVGAVVAL